MKRIPEPPLMENPLQAKVYAEADFSSTDQLFVTRLKEHFLEIPKTLYRERVIVDLGCGPGNITEHIALQWPQAQIIGVDGSEAMLSIARTRQRDFAGRVQKIDYRNLFLSSEESQFS